MGEQKESFKAFLASVDTKPPQEEAVVNELCDILWGQHVKCGEHLVGAELKFFKGVPEDGRGLFLLRAIRKANKDFAESRPRSPSSSASAGSASTSAAVEAFVQAVQASAPKADKKKKVVNVSALMEKVTLSGLNNVCMPSGKLVDEMASEVQSLSDAGVVKPFLFSDLRRFLPFWGTPGEDSDFVSGEQAAAAAKATSSAMDTVQKESRPLTMAQWQLAFDFYQIAAVATGQWSFTGSRAHKIICQEVAFGAPLQGRSGGLCIIYDKLRRRVPVFFGSGCVMFVFARQAFVGHACLRE